MYTRHRTRVLAYTHYFTASMYWLLPRHALRVVGVEEVVTAAEVYKLLPTSSDAMESGSGTEVE